MSEFDGADWVEIEREVVSFLQSKEAIWLSSMIEALGQRLKDQTERVTALLEQVAEGKPQRQKRLEDENSRLRSALERIKRYECGCKPCTCLTPDIEAVQDFAREALQARQAPAHGTGANHCGILGCEWCMDAKKRKQSEQAVDDRLENATMPELEAVFFPQVTPAEVSSQASGPVESRHEATSGGAAATELKPSGDDSGNSSAPAAASQSEHVDLKPKE